MSVTTHERPGVYSSYDASSIIGGKDGNKTVGLVAVSTAAQANIAVTVTSYEEAMTTFGEGDAAELVRLALKNGAGAVVVVPTADATGYESALTVLEGLDGISLAICDSTELTVQQMLRSSVVTASNVRRERLAVVGGERDETVAALIARAGELSCERVVLVGPGGVDSSGLGERGIFAAAAVAGTIAGDKDPAIPLGGAELSGLYGLAARYSDNEIDLLVQGGVTPLEEMSGTVSVVRGVTTRTKTDGAEDRTWRELTTIRVVDDVIPQLRTALRSKFRRAKNTAQSRSAIRSQVILELENKLGKEIITAYDNVTVAADTENPTICLVDLAFTVAHGLSQIWIAAHISV